MSFFNCIKKKENKTFYDVETKTFYFNSKKFYKNLQIPIGALSLIFCDDFNDEISYFKLFIPVSLKTIEFGKKFNNTIKSGTFFKNIETLIFKDNFNITLRIFVPKVKNIYFGKNFNKTINNIIFRDLENVHFKSNFRQPISNLSFKNVKNTLNFWCENELIIFNSFEKKFNIYFYDKNLANLYLLDKFDCKLFFIRNNKCYSLESIKKYECLVCLQDFYLIDNLVCEKCKSNNLTVCKECLKNIKKCLICGNLIKT